MTGHTQRLIFGAAYYDEYTPASAGPDRLERDMQMMVDAGFTTIRIAEFTWGTWNPAPGIFDWHHIDRAIDAAAAHSLDVIIGTPTAAVPTWLAARHPEIMGVSASGQPNQYGPRQNMDITAPAYRYYGEQAIRALVEHTAPRANVVGFQLDNETKYYDAYNPDIQRAFIDWLKARFNGDLDALNAAYGLNYWANRVGAWEEFPDVSATINGSLGAAFDEFRRSLVTDFLAWQRAIVDDYRREDQFVTHNFDYEWRGHSFGIQGAVDHFTAADALTLAGVDIYHPGEDRLTGKEIAFGGDISRCLKDGAPYLVLETQAQGQMGWLPYPGQLRLQGYSHLASGALGLMYWHWGSTHNAFETYWKGLLSQDYSPNPTYREACVLGQEMREHAASLSLTKTNRIAIMVSNEAYTALEWFSIASGFPRTYAGGGVNYNDVFRWVYDALFDLNLEADVVPADTPLERLERYDALITPALYAAPQTTIDTLRAYTTGGGHLVTTFRTAVADENVQVWADRQPHGLSGLLGLGTDQFTTPDGVRLAPVGALAERLGQGTDLGLSHVLELLTPVEAPEAGSDVEVLATYDHHAWSGPAIATRSVGAGTITHLGAWASAEVLRAVLALVAERAGVTDWAGDLAGTITVRKGVNAVDNPLAYLLNYSKDDVELTLPVSGTDVLGTTGQAGSALAAGQTVTVPAWGVLVLEGTRA
ncbi:MULTISPECIES: beta-galactosidase [Actinomyces]|uniref:beta-galactosidase n=1 Tax=Actinomyces respiraculi TaxID=2744574 RepID=A0A7T0LKF2_9ACTO|nr:MULTISPECIES: beta-galactosidase [Actinomyces]QPL05404.1 beta-galactosidase [Actinomyces respiraculi]